MSREYPCVYYKDQKCEKFAEPGYVSWCVMGPCSHETPSNADRIRAMSDEELANWLARTQYANMMEAAEIFGTKLPFEEKTLKGSEKECLKWLKQPAEGGL